MNYWKRLLLVLVVMFSVITVACENSSDDNDDPSYPKPDKLCALTFDDGPDNVKTMNVLEKLDAHKVKGSFFQIGQMITGNQDAVDAIVERGFEIHNHSNSTESMNEMSEADVLASYNACKNAIINATPDGYTDNYTSFFRPPNLVVSDTMYETIPDPFAVGIIAGDFPTEYGGTATIEGQLANILNSDNLKDGAIILMHDVQGHDYYNTPGLLDKLIPELKKRGYEMVGLSEMFKRKKIEPDWKDDWEDDWEVGRNWDVAEVMYCALTFDDGPDNTLTLNVLEKLDNHGVKGSFFQIGQMITNNQDAVDAIVARGFEIHNHSNAWDSMNEMSEEDVLASYNECKTAIINATPAGYTDNYTFFFRPPNLAVGGEMDAIPDPFSIGIVAGDFPTEYGGTATIEGQLANIINSADLRDGAIILMHDVQSHDYYDTPGLLDLLIPELQSRGYILVGLSEMFERKGIDPSTKDSWTVAE